MGAGLFRGLTPPSLALGMPTASGDRSAYFPAIEKKHGGPISLWIERVKGLGGAKYEEQIAFLREDHGFSQAHANALVMYVRGSTTSKKFDTLDAYYATLEPAARGTVQVIVAAINEKHPKLKWVIAWNQPMLRTGKTYLFGLSAAKKHILLLPMGPALETLADRLAKYETNKKTFQVPLDEVGWMRPCCGRW